MRPIKFGATDQSTIIRALNASTGVAVTNVSAGTAGLAVRYNRTRSLPATVTVANLASARAAHSDGGIIHLHAGYYRLDVPDAAFASGAVDVAITAAGTNLSFVGAYHPLVRQNPADVASSAWNFATRSLTAGASVNAASRLSVASSVWSFATRGLTDKAAIASTIWVFATRSLTDKAEFALSSATVLKIASAAWTRATRSLTDKDGFRLSAAGVDDVWDEDVVAAHQTNKTAGRLLAEIVRASTQFASTVHARSVIGQIVADGSATYNRATDSLQAIRDRGDVAWLTGGGGSALETASAVWAFASRTLTAFGFTVPASVTFTAPQKAALASTVWAAAARTLTDKSGFDLSTAGKAALASAVWNAAARTLTGFGFTVNASTLSTLTAAQKAAIASSVWAAAARSLTAGASVNSQSRLSIASSIWSFATRSVTGAVNVDRLAGSSSAVAKLKAGASALVTGTALGGSTASTVVTNLSEATDDHYNGRVVVFRSGALDGQAAEIKDYNGTTKTLTVSALTEAPASGVVFTIA